MVGRRADSMPTRGHDRARIDLAPKAVHRAGLIRVAPSSVRPCDSRIERTKVAHRDDSNRVVPRARHVDPIEIACWVVRSDLRVAPKVRGVPRGLDARKVRGWTNSVRAPSRAHHRFDQRSSKEDHHGQIVNRRGRAAAPVPPAGRLSRFRRRMITTYIART